MNNRIEHAMRQSASDFINVVWPVINEYFGGGELIPVEIVTDSGFTEKLDQLAGIDAWHILNNKQGMRALASRVQWYNPKWSRKYPFNTFSIRHELRSGFSTEEYKRQYALRYQNRGLLFPYATIQAYLDKPGENLLSFGIIKTEELFGFLLKQTWPIIPVEDGNKMKILSWKILAGFGAESLLYKDTTSGETYHA